MIAVAAQADGDLAGYLCGVIAGNELRIPLAGHAVRDARVAGQLYAAVARQAVERDVRAHQIVVARDPADAALDIWYGLSFGREQAYGVASVARTSGTRHAAVTVRTASLDDLDEVVPLAGLVATLQNDAPVFSAVGDDFFAQLRDAHAEELMNPESTYYVADRGDRIDGLAITAPAPASPTVPERALEIVFQVTRSDVRGTGIGTSLFQRICRDAHEQGYRVLVADWRTTNQLASTFWPGRGFRPVAYRLRRVIGAA